MANRRFPQERRLPRPIDDMTAIANSENHFAAAGHDKVVPAGRGADPL